MRACLPVPAHTMFCRAKPGFLGSLVARVFPLVWLNHVSVFAKGKMEMEGSPSLTVAHPGDGMSAAWNCFDGKSGASAPQCLKHNTVQWITWLGGR